MTNQPIFTIEEFDGSDESYAACVTLSNGAFPDYPSTVADAKRRDSKRNPDHHYQRFVGRDDSGQIVAAGNAGHNSGAFHAQKFWVEVLVAPEKQGLGFGRTLHAHILQSLVPFNPISVEGGTRDGKPRTIRFLEDRGYEMKTREYSSKLDLTLFNPDAFASYSEQCRSANIELLDHNEIEARFPDSWARKLYDCVTEIEQDIPWHDTLTMPEFDRWLDRHSSHDDRIPECFIVAVDGDTFVGVTMLFRSKATVDTVYTGLTGVRRSHRRKGVAVALKCQSLGWAKANLQNSSGNAPSVMTENEEANPMFKINERMGFVRQPDFLNYVKTLQ